MNPHQYTLFHALIPLTRYICAAKTLGHIYILWRYRCATSCDLPPWLCLQHVDSTLQTYCSLSIHLETVTSDLPAAELKQALAQQKRVTEEEQANARSAQQQLQDAHSLIDQLSKALEAKDSMLTAVQVFDRVPFSVISHALM